MKRADLPKVIADMEEVVHAAALRPEQWQEVADRLCIHAPGIKITMQSWDRGVSQPIPLVTAGWTLKGAEDYAAYYARINPWKQAWLDMPFMQTVWTDNYLSNAELRRTECYTDFLRVEGEADSGTGVKLIDEPDRLANFAVNYGSRKGEETHAVVGPLIQRLASGMRRAIDVNRTIYRSTLAGATGTNLLTALLDPAFIVDRSCRLLAANDPGQKLIAEGLLLRLAARDIVHFDDRQAGQIFSERVRRACAPLSDNDRTGIEDLALTHHSGAFTVTIMPVRQNFQAMTLKGILPLFMPTIVALVVVRPRLKRSLHEELRHRYRLTETEAAVTVALLSAATLAQVADQLGISYETVRSHLRAVFVKTGVNQQKQLVALALRLAESG